MKRQKLIYALFVASLIANAWLATELLVMRNHATTQKQAFEDLQVRLYQYKSAVASQGAKAAMDRIENVKRIP